MEVSSSQELGFSNKDFLILAHVEVLLTTAFSSGRCARHFSGVKFIFGVKCWSYGWCCWEDYLFPSPSVCLFSLACCLARAIRE